MKRVCANLLVAKMHEDAPEIAAVLFDAVIEIANLGLVEKAQDAFLQLTAAFAGV